MSLENDEAALEIDQFHMHELVDRAHCLNVMFNELLRDHPAAHLAHEEIEAAGAALEQLYQKAGNLAL